MQLLQLQPIKVACMIAGFCLSYCDVTLTNNQLILNLKLCTYTQESGKKKQQVYIKAFNRIPPNLLNYSVSCT